MEAEQWEYAGYEWRMALEKNPGNMAAHIGLTEMLMKSGQTAEAVRHVEQARKHIAKLPLELTYGQALEKNRQFVKASNLYRAILGKIPLESNSFNRLIAIKPLLPVSEQKALKAYLEKGAQSASRHGEESLKAQKYQAAVNYFRISTAYAPNVTDLNNYGAALVLLGRYNEADEQFDKLKKAESSKWQYYANAAFAVLGQGNAHEAGISMENAIRLCADAPKKPYLYNDLGYIYESQGKWDKARTAYEHAIELNPRFTKARFNLAYVYQKERHYEEAIRLYRQMLSQDRKNTKILNQLGFVYELAHEDRKALSVYHQAAKLNPREKDAFYNLSLLYRKLGETKDADKAFKKMMAIEFDQLEGDKANAQNQRSANNSRQNGASRLLDFADVFFVEPG